MTVTTSSTTILNKVASSLVATQKYATIEEALWELALTTVRNKVIYYQRRIRKLERKYHTDFDSFTIHLKGRATPAEEDDWLAWKSARRMLADWRKAYRDLLNERAR
ncbi:MAG: hypothetical protein HY872_06820 [Chloroflexi bacterium]|nr:hypothetical protein [Chloroflexota bacterium]